MGLIRNKVYKERIHHLFAAVTRCGGEKQSIVTKEDKQIDNLALPWQSEK